MPVAANEVLHKSPTFSMLLVSVRQGPLFGKLCNWPVANLAVQAYSPALAAVGGLLAVNEASLLAARVAGVWA